VTSKAEEYRVQAIECDKLATAARDAKTKTQFEELARRWRELAKQVDMIGRS